MFWKVDNSSLTGESVAVARGNVEGTANILESPNVAFFSTQCVEGWAIGKLLTFLNAMFICIYLYFGALTLACA